MASASSVASSSPLPEAGSSGEFVLKKLFAEFVAVGERKLQHACSQPLDYSLAKGLVRGEDATFDQILSALNEVSSFCLRSVLTSIFKWRDMQMEECRSVSSVASSEVTESPFPSSKRDKGHVMERRELAVDFLFCLVLVEVMPRLSVHPVPESFIHNIEDLAFQHFKQQESIKGHRTYSNPNVTNMRKIADLYAEVIGVLSQSRFHSVRHRFFLEIRNQTHSSATIISIIEGMSFIRVKMFPVEELEQWFAFLQECAHFFLDCPREKIKAAMSALLVDVLLPVAAVINVEISLPVVKKLVSVLYGHCTEHAKRARHSNTYIPLATVLLAISEQSFFLNNWHHFLAQNLLPSLKRGDTKIHTIALVSLYRLVWVYMIRIRGESNKTTMIRLRTILDVLFPRGQRGVLPKEMPLNIFVKLIQFIARERLEYAMQEVILELLNQGRSKTAINPERMIIGLRAFLMITDSLEKKEGDPPMPINTGPLPSRGVSRVKIRFLSNTLSNETAKKIGVVQFYPGVRRALDGILRSLDHQVGHQLTSTNPQPGKSVEEMLSTVKPKLDLLKTCVAAIPRILPESMSRDDLTDLLSRLTIHLDHELGRAAANSLHTMVTNYPAWRHDIVRVFVQFLLRDVPDSCPLVLEATLKLLIQFIRDWKQMIISPSTTKSVSDDDDVDGENVYCIPWVEACGLVTLCSYRSVTRRFSLVLLKEVRGLHEALAGETNRVEETPVMDVIESVTPLIVKRYLSTLSFNQRNELRVANQSLNLNWLADRAGCFLEQGGSREAMRDPWALCLAGLMEPHLLPQACYMATRLAWPRLYHRMVRAYMVLDPSGLVADKGDKPSSMRGRQRPVISSVETFLWRNYFIFASCSAPPSSSQDSSSITARDLFSRVVPLIRWDGEVREVAITALGLVHPPAFGDLVEQLQPVIHDALEQRKDVKRRRRREALKIQITRVFALAAEHGCFQHSHMARTEHGQIAPVLLDFIEGIRSYLDIEKEGVHNYPELRLHFAALISNIINGVSQSPVLLFSAVTRQSLFYLFANWCGLFGQRVDIDVRSRNPQVSYSSLQAMSALLCCGTVFQSNGLDASSPLYCWLDNMLTCNETRVQTLGRKTVQLLLHNNANCPTLLNWVVDRCYDNRPGAAQLCFHALSNTVETYHDYPCDMVTILHVVLFKTADPEHVTRERAIQLLQILDHRFLAESDHSRPELLGCLTGGAYSQSHVTFSRELATSNPELTYPLFSEMVYRFEMSPHSGQRTVLQYMVPWLCNVELVEENPHSPYISHGPVFGHTSWPHPSSAVLQGTGWGSLEGTKLVLHNLLYITAKYGEEHVPEVERLWSALCSWQNNLRITINSLARLTCACGNMSAMVQQAKRIMVSFSRTHATAIIVELIRDLQSVEIISADLQPSDSPPFYCLAGSQSGVERGEKSDGEEGWTVRWRAAVRGKETTAVPLPTLPSKQYYASLQPLLKLPVRQLAPLHRCNFALMVLSELVLELRCNVDWFVHLPLLLHVALLGLDVMRPLVYEHSKAMLGNLVVVLACRDDMLAALQARVVQQECRSCSPLAGEGGEDRVQRTLSLDPTNTCLLDDAQEIIKFISQREGHRPRWPFADISSRLAPSGEVPDLSALVNMILRVFSHSGPADLKGKWARKALHWATSCSSHQYASQSFQVCRALQLPLSPAMFREILTRLAESASDTNEDMQSYVLEIVLTLECALDHLPEPQIATVDRPDLDTETTHKISDLSPLPSDSSETPLSPPASDSSARGRHHHRVRSITSTQDMVPQRPASAYARIQSPLPVLVTPHQTPPPSLPPPASVSPTVPQTTEHVDGVLHREKEVAAGAEVEEEEEEAVAEDGEKGFLLELKDNELKGRIRMKLTPFSSNRHLQPSNSPQKNAEHFHAFSDTTALSSSDDYSREDQQETRSRKGSEPPPSLVALFERDSGNMTEKQQINENEELHSKQHAFDDSRLSTPPTQGSPRRGRRMKSPVLSDREPEKTMTRAPSHPHLHQTTSTPHFSQQSSQPLTKARSIQQLRAASPTNSDGGRKRRCYSGGREDMKLLKPRQLRKQEIIVQTGSKESLPTSSISSVASLKVRNEVERTVHKGMEREASQRQMSVDAVPMRSSAKSSSDMWRRNSTQIGMRTDVVTDSRGRPHSMVETSTLRPYHSMEFNPTPSALVAQMFWTAVSLLESDFEAEFSMALRLISKCLEKLDLSLPESQERLEKLLPKFKWPNFPGVQSLLMKGLTLESVAYATHSLLVYITPFCTQPVFDPSRCSGLPLNIMALMPVLVHHFNKPTSFCLKAVASIRRACEAMEVSSADCKIKLQHMSRMFEIYGEFSTGCDVWLAGICRYLNEAYMSITMQIIALLTTMLEQGPSLYHRPVLRLLYEYLRLQEPLPCGMHGLVNSTMVVVHRHLRGPLWKEAVDLLKVAVSSSAALVQPPTRGLPVDLGLFKQTLPGPTLQFKMDLQPNSSDLSLAQESLVQSSWKNPAGSQLCTRERLLSVINACVPIPVLMSSPSVIFTDEQALIDKAALQSSASDEASSSLASVPGDLSSQPEAQSLISVEFNFLDNMEYIYDSSSESETPPGPFSRPGEEAGLGEEEEEEEESFSDSEVVEFSMSDLEQRDPLSSYTQSETLAPSYDSQSSLSSQLLVLSQTQQTVPEEEEPVSEQSFPYGSIGTAPVHHHESSHASTLTEGSPESRDTSTEPRDTSTEYYGMKVVGREVEEGREVTSEDEGAVTQDMMVKEQSVDEEPELESAKSESESSRDSTWVGVHPHSYRSEPLTLEGVASVQNRQQSEPPVLIREQSLPIVQPRGQSEPPTQLKKQPSKQLSPAQLNELPALELPVQDRQLSEPPLLDRQPSKLQDRAFSEPPEQDRQQSKPPVQEQDRLLSDLPFQDSQLNEPNRQLGHPPAGEPPLQENNPPVQGRQLQDSETPIQDRQLSEASVEDWQLSEPSVEGRQLSEPPVKLSEPSVEGRQLSEPPVQLSEPSVQGHQLSQPPVQGRQLSEPPVQLSQPSVEGRQLSEPLSEPSVQGHQLSEPPVQLSEPSVQGRQLSEPPVQLSQPSVEGRQLPVQGRQLSEPPVQLSEPSVEGRQLSEPPVQLSEPSVQGRQLSEPPVQLSEPSVEGRQLSEPPVQGRQLSEPPVQLSQPSVEGRQLSEPPVQGRQLSEPPVQLSEPSVEGRQLSEPPVQGRQLSEPPVQLSEPSVEGRQLSEPTVQGRQPPVLMEGSECNKNDDEMSTKHEDAEETFKESNMSMETTSTEASHFLCVSNEEVGDVWRRHVVSLGQDKSRVRAVYTHFLFLRLFPVLRQQFTVLTREACNYLGLSYNAIASHFLVTVELLSSELQLPSVYIDSELLVQTRLLDSHVFLTLEIDGNLDVYYERRRTVLQRLDHIKLQLRHQSGDQEQLSEKHAEVVSLSPEEATLKLCQAVHRLHFQLLVLLGSYVKLLHSLQPYLKTTGGVEVSQELTEVERRVEENVQLLGRVPSPMLEQFPHTVYTTVDDVLRTLQDALSQKQWLQAVQLLRAARRQHRDVELFGSTEDDDVDCLFFIYASFLTDNQEGVLCITCEENELSEVHGRLMEQNVSLHALLEATQQTLSVSDHATPT